MAGVTKHIYNHDIQDILSMWNTQLKSVSSLLQLEYTKEDIISLLKKFYPHEWKSVEIKYEYYRDKDSFLIKRFGRPRFKMNKPDQLLTRSMMYQKIMSENFKNNHKVNYSDSRREESEEKLWIKRRPKIQRIDDKIQKSLMKTQQVTPDFIDQLIGLYERKTTSQADRMYILAELKKYYSPRIMKFFFKLNDTELNKQLRWEAFYHLQSFNYHPRARRQKYMLIHAKNPRRKNFLRYIYPDQKFSISQTPQELEYRIQNSKEQQIKRYDFFISHSSKDYSAVQNLITKENRSGKDVFCDWINDADYLKRHLLCNATLKVIEYRLEQSKALIFVSSDNSSSSVWCKYELNYFYNLGRPIYILDKEDILQGKYKLHLMTDLWFLDPNYKNMTLMT